MFNFIVLLEINGPINLNINFNSRAPDSSWKNLGENPCLGFSSDYKCYVSQFLLTQ